MKVDLVSPTKVVSLAEISDRIDYGYTASATTRPVGPKFLRITDIQNGQVDWTDVPYCQYSGTPDDKANLRPGDIVFARTGATTGKSYLIRQCPVDSVFASYLIRVRPSQRVNARYLAHFFQTPNYWAQIYRNSAGTAQEGVNASKLKQLQVPLPSLEEQQYIADLLDRIEHLRQLRIKCLFLLDELLPAVFIDIFGDPITNPFNWKRLPFEELLEAIESGWSPVCLDRPAAPDEWGILKLGAVTQCIYLEEENKALTADRIPRPALEVKSGDLLFSRKNTKELVAACALVHHSRQKLMLPDLIFRFCLKPNAPCRPEYLWGLFTNTSKRKHVQQLASGTSGSMPNISKEKLKKLLIEIPSTDRQIKYAQAYQTIRRIQNEMAQSLDHLEQLFSSAQNELFAASHSLSKQESVDV
ncbi:MAG TPA: restriction endonuclease subunit S [Oculatellaceae cyanobacterium]